MDNQPLVSIVIPCYNLGAYINDAVESVKAQTYRNFEIIIVDDGSTDQETIDVLNLIDPEIAQVYHIKNRKLPGARNYGINKAKGEYIVCLDADDMLAPEYLEKTTDKLKKGENPRVAFVTTWLREFGERSNIWKTSNYDISKLLVTNRVHAGSMFKKSVWQEVKGYNESMTAGYEDWEFWLSIVEKGYSWDVVPEPLFLYRIRTNSMLTSSRTVHIDIYKKLYELHKELFSKYAKELVIENAKQLKELHEIIAQKDLSIKEYINYKDEVIELRSQTFTLRDELHTLKNSRVVGRVIKLRDFTNSYKRKLKSLPDRISRKCISLASKLIPKFIKQTLKRIWFKLTTKKVIYRRVSNKFWEKQKPIVSVVIPYFNRADTIDETLNSLIKQTFTNFEMTIVDDGSTEEESIQKLKDIKAQNPKTNIIFQENKGVAEARNNGISNSDGKYILCLDSDDVLDPTYIEKCVIVLESDPDISLVSTHQEMFGVINESYKKSKYDPLHLNKDNMVITAAMFRKEAWQNSGGYRSEIGYEDWEFWLRLSEHGYWGKLIPEFLFRYRTSMQSRYVEDKDLHWKNIKKIQTLHPNYRKRVRKLLKARGNTRKIIEPTSAFINLDSPRVYSQQSPTKKNVLIAIPWMTFGGAETLIVNFCNEVKDKFNLSFITGLESEHEWEYKFKGITPNVFHLTNLFDNTDLYLEFISNYIKTRNISILHIIHTSFIFEMLPELKHRHPELKVVVTVFNDRAHFHESVSQQSYIDIYTSDNAAVANHYMQELDKHSEERIKIIPNGINSYETFNPGLFDRPKQRAELGLKPEELAVFFIGRLSEEKNPDVFLEVAKSVTESQRTNIKFFVIGDGIMRPKIEKQITNIRNENVKYLGYQSEIAKYLSAADIFVLPSSIEGFPLSILEAMAMRVCTIASDVGAVAEVIQSGKDGFVVSPGSVKEIEETILKLNDNPELLSAIKVTAREKIEKKYSNKVLGANYKNMYKAALK